MFTLTEVSTTSELASFASSSSTIFLPDEVEPEPWPCKVITILYLSGVTGIGSHDTLNSLSKPPFKEVIEILGTPIGLAGLE